MKVFPGSALLQATQGPTAAQVNSSRGAAQQFAATLRAAGLSEPPQKAEHPRQILHPSSSEKPRPDLPRGSLIDITV
jgi:hypothetical protein